MGYYYNSNLGFVVEGIKYNNIDSQVDVLKHREALKCLEFIEGITKENVTEHNLISKISQAKKLLQFYGRKIPTINLDMEYELKKLLEQLRTLRDVTYAQNSKDSYMELLEYTKGVYENLKIVHSYGVSGKSNKCLLDLHMADNKKESVAEYRKEATEKSKKARRDKMALEKRHEVLSIAEKQGLREHEIEGLSIQEIENKMESRIVDKLGEPSCTEATLCFREKLKRHMGAIERLADEIAKLGDFESEKIQNLTDSDRKRITAYWGITGVAGNSLLAKVSTIYEFHEQWKELVTFRNYISTGNKQNFVLGVNARIGILRSIKYFDYVLRGITDESVQAELDLLQGLQEEFGTQDIIEIRERCYHDFGARREHLAELIRIYERRIERENKEHSEREVDINGECK